MSLVSLALVLSLSATDGGADDDGGVATKPGPPLAGLAWSADGGAALAVWASDRRDQAFGPIDRRGADLWSNELGLDGGLKWPQGRIVCPASAFEAVELPRVASAGGVSWVAWRGRLATHDVVRATPVRDGVGVACETLVTDLGGAGRVENLWLAAQGAEVLLAWETDSAVEAVFLNVPNASPFTLVRKGEPTAPPRSLAPFQGQFILAWRENTALRAVTAGLSASPVVGTISVPSNEGYESDPVAAQEPPFRMAYVTTSVITVGGSPAVKAADLAGVGPYFAPSAFDVQGPHLAANESLNATVTRTRVTYAAGGHWWLADLASTGAPSPVRLSVVPLAMIGSPGQTVLLGEDDVAEHQLDVYVGPLALSSGASRRTAVTRVRPSELAHSATALPDGAFYAGFSVTGQAHGLQLDARTGGRLGSAEPWPADAGVSRFFQAPDGRPVASATADTSSWLTPVGVTDRSVWATRLLSVDKPGLTEAVIGRNTFALWAADGPYLASGQGAITSTAESTARYGRCGDRTGDTLLVPVAWSDRLEVILIDDTAAATRTPAVIERALNLQPPCLATRDDRVLVVTASGDGALRAWVTTVTGLRSGASPTPVQVPRGPSDSWVVDPVAIATSTGWIIAFERVRLTRSELVVLRLSADGTPQGEQLVDLASDFEARAPRLARNADGAVLLAYQGFADQTGGAVVRARVLVQGTSAPDGGTVDGGALPMDDAGVPDGGVEGRDGGAGADAGAVSELVFRPSGCGCSAGLDASLAAVALLLLAARARGRR